MHGIQAYIALGSNLGDRLGTLRRAVEALDGHPEIRVERVSPVYESEAHTLRPNDEQPHYLNAVVEVRTTLEAHNLLDYLLVLEREAGRRRRERWAPRTLDLDLLLYGSETCEGERLTLPHPRMGERRFVLQPLADLAPDLHVPPPFDVTVAELLRRCPDAAALHRVPLDLRSGDPSSRPTPPAPGHDARRGEVSLELPENLRYIVIEGVIGAGKTTLAQMLAERFEGKLVLEEFEENPFLERFYEDRRRWAFQTQLAFLASRFRQQKELLAPDLFHRLMVADYSFDKDRIFAHLNLEGDELALYETLFGLMEPTTRRPDLVVYLRSTPERLLDNIRLRRRPYEANMDPAYIAALHEAHEQYFNHYSRSPVLVVNVATIDFVENPDVIVELVRHMTAKQHSGTTYFRPASSRTTEI